MSIHAADALMGIFGFKRIEEKAMDKVSETRRALFEAYFDRMQSTAEHCGHGLNQYHLDLMESAFNAALDAVEIELPETHSTNGGDCVVDYEECLTAIESTNLGLRIK